MPNRRETFRHIVQKVAGRNASALETRARQANWLAHSHPSQARKLFRIKNRLMSQLFMVEGYEPTILDCVPTVRGLLLSVQLSASWGRLHVPLDRLAPRARGYVLNPRARIFRTNKCS